MLYCTVKKRFSANAEMFRLFATFKKMTEKRTYRGNVYRFVRKIAMFS